MSNGSNTLPWVIALIASIAGAGAVGFVGGRYSAETTAPAATAATPEAQQQAQNQPNNGLPPGATTEQSGDWTLLCQDGKDGKKGCVAVENVLNPDKNLILRVLATYDNKSDKILIVNTPLGVDLNSGVDFTLPGKPKNTFAFASCNQVSCDAVLTVKDDGYAALDQAGTFEIAYIRGDGQRVAANVSMKGLTDAYTKIEKPPVPTGASAGTAPAGAEPVAPATPDTTTPAPAGKPAKPAKPSKPNGG